MVGTKGGKWVCGWGVCENAIVQTMSEIFSDTTCRYNIFSTIDASRVRLIFSNRRGTSKITIDEVFVSKALDFGSHAADASAFVQVTFGGKHSLTLDPGEKVTSDEVMFNLSAGETLSVSTYVAGVTELRAGHTISGKFIKKLVTRGNFAASAELPIMTTGEAASYAFLCGADFYAESDCEAVVTFGDSITAQPWPDYFARRLHSLGIKNRTVVRKAIGGSRVLRGYPQRAKLNWGEAGIERFENDICQSGATKVILLHGTNDLIHPLTVVPYCGADQFPTTEELIAGYKYYIDTAHKHGMKVYQGTILPCSRPYMFEGELPRLRQLAELNEWIRGSGYSDGVIEFNHALRDPEQPDRMIPHYTEDDLHPTLAGAQKMAETVPLEYIL